jgi:2-polyprenyl-3-methyl-5-hydroxy-6-metoxy-1,4-benzoquinol methylase
MSGRPDRPVRRPGDPIAVLEEIARTHDTHVDFDGVLARYTAEIICPRVRGMRVIEAGCSTGVMTERLLDEASEVHIVEGSRAYAEAVRLRFPGVASITCSLFEDFRPPLAADAVVAAGVLHHLADPVSELKHMATWVRPGGVIHITVPNMTSLHRRLGVAMKVSGSVYDTSERNVRFAQPGRYDAEKLRRDVEAAGLVATDSLAFFLKPFPHGLMNSIDFPEEMLRGLFSLGIEFPELACQLYIEARTPGR